MAGHSLHWRRQRKNGFRLMTWDGWMDGCPSLPSSSSYLSWGEAVSLARFIASLTPNDATGNKEGRKEGRKELGLSFTFSLCGTDWRFWHVARARLVENTGRAKANSRFEARSTPYNHTHTH